MPDFVNACIWPSLLYNLGSLLISAKAHNYPFLSFRRPLISWDHCSLYHVHDHGVHDCGQDQQPFLEYSTKQFTDYPTSLPCTPPCHFTKIKGHRLTLISDTSPAGTWCHNGVTWTSMRRQYVASTSIYRHFAVTCQLENVFRFAFNWFYISSSIPESSRMFKKSSVISLNSKKQIWPNCKKDQDQPSGTIWVNKLLHVHPVLYLTQLFWFWGSTCIIFVWRPYWWCDQDQLKISGGSLWNLGLIGALLSEQ